VTLQSLSGAGECPCPGYLSSRVLLSKISDQILVQLYSGLQDKPWSRFQHQVDHFHKELSQWVECLPEHLRIDGSFPTEPNFRARLELNASYQSVLMILHRPGLCDIHIVRESVNSQEWNVDCARICVRAAMALIDLLPDDPRQCAVYESLPWWALLHYLCQAAAVLILELCLKTLHMPEANSDVKVRLRKSLAYIRRLGDSSLSAYSAWRNFMQLCSALPERIGYVDVDDTSSEGHRPPGWTRAYENSLPKATEGV